MTDIDVNKLITTQDPAIVDLMRKGVAADEFSKADVSSFLDRRAAALQKQGESHAQSYTRLFVGRGSRTPAEDEVGGKLFKLMMAMPGRDHHAQAAFEKAMPTFTVVRPGDAPSAGDAHAAALAAQQRAISDWTSFLSEIKNPGETASATIDRAMRTPKGAELLARAKAPVAHFVAR